MKFKKTTNNLTVILTAFRAGRSLEENYIDNEALRAEALALGLTHETDGIGSYREEGQAVASREISMVFSSDNNFDIRKLIKIACTHYQQDCCLLLCHSVAFLVSVDEAGYLPHTEIGNFLPCTKEEAQQAVAYSWFNGQYYTCK